MGGSDVAEALRIGKCLLREDLDDARVGCTGVGRRGNGGAPRDAGRRPKVKEEVKEERGKAIVVLTDGGESTERVLQEVDQAHQLGISLFFVGVGSEKGGTVPELDWDGKVTGAKTDAQGKPVTSRLDREGLQALAQVAGDQARYVEVGPEGRFDVTPILEQLNQVQRGELERTEEDRPRPIYHWFLFPGLMLLVIEASIGLRRRVKHPEAVP
jgi:Ca-activated chloride channel family protein